MASPQHYKIVNHFGTLPTQVVTGENPDGDTRYMVSQSYTFQGETRRRVWLTRRQLQDVFRCIGQFLYGSEVMEAVLPMLEESKEDESAVVNGTDGIKPPFID